MELLKAIILGFIQGVAEFLPISSSGHLAIFKNVLGFDTDTGLLFDVLLHLGTLAAVFVVFHKDIFELIKEGFAIIGQFFKSVFGCLFKKAKWQPVVTTPYRRFVMLVIVSTIPTGIMGILLEDAIGAASATLIVPGILLLLNGIQLLISDRLPDGALTEADASYGKAAIVGVAQGIATFPGISRSGTTITACLACGFKREFAVKYSFIMSIPAILGALVLELFDFSPEMLSGSDRVNYLAGTLVSAVVGYGCIKTMLVSVR
ncbi:MAG: undecaprenyl-diphosphate phosphatase, partial [Lachnospiraceae bacterium]|nr:undecaprenyl-diphosphate phosphatase [Lachnospiraceae bacterium]